MIAAGYNLQRKAQHGNAATFHCGMGRAAPIADGYQSQFPRGRFLPRRANCRGLQRTPAFFFQRGKHGLPPVARSLRMFQSLTHQSCCQAAVGREVHSTNRLSSVAVFDDQQLSERHIHSVGPFTQGLGNV